MDPSSTIRRILLLQQWIAPCSSENSHKSCIQKTLTWFFSRMIHFNTTKAMSDESAAQQQGLLQTLKQSSFRDNSFEEVTHNFNRQTKQKDLKEPLKSRVETKELLESYSSLVSSIIYKFPNQWGWKKWGQFEQREGKKKTRVEHRYQRQICDET